MDSTIKKLDTYFDWDHQIASCDTIEEISELEKTKSKHAFDFLRRELGEGFPKEIMDHDTRFRSYFWNKAPWTRVWFTWLSEAIKNLKEAENFGSVIKKLKSGAWDDFEEAITLLEYGLKFRKVGFQLAFEKETLNTNGKSKNPDLYLTNPETAENIFVEVTRLTPNAELEDLFDIYHRAMNKGYFSGKQINCCGRLFKSVSKEHLREIKQEVDKKVEAVLKNNSFEEFKKDGIIEMAFVGESNYSTLEQWSSEHGYKIGSFILPEIDRFKRLKNKIVKKI
ncbi:MAG: hypothetical protein H7282_09290 [Cytophagaceae bacterium]|nr:hypothetical protein [Cytophagaceae bacterium]